MNLSAQLAEQGVSLVAVSKTHPPDRIMELYKEGQRDFGENKVQELTSKYEVLPKDIRWHLIGHLQRNKVKYIAPFVHLIHSVDSLELLQEIDKQAAKCGRVIDVLLQFHIAAETTKFGLDLPEAEALLAHNLPNVRIRGVMGMATFTDDMDQVRREFDTLMGIFTHLKSRWFRESAWFDIRSMGMSGDWPVAVAAGSNMVRIGSLLFGERNYPVE